MELGEAHALISRAIASGRPAHGYLIVGDLAGNARDLVERILGILFPKAVRDENGRIVHPDIVRLEPMGKSGRITVDSMRENIVEPMSCSAYSGGWKVGLIVCADRMNDESANAFLKSLEEPTPQTMFLLLTDRPDAILPTIVSRCQRIDLPLSQGVLTSENYAAVAEVFETKGLVSFAAKGCAARHLTELLEQMEEDLPDGDFTSLRKDFFRTIMSFVRRWMIESSVPRHAAFANVEAVETAYRRCDRSNIPKSAALAAMMERLTFPS